MPIYARAPARRGPCVLRGAASVRIVRGCGRAGLRFFDRVNRLVATAARVAVLYRVFA